MGLLDDEGLGAAFGNEMLRRRATNERARMLARQQEPSLPPDINSSQFPRVNAAIQGLLGTAPDEMGISVLNPQAESIKAAADPAYVIGMALQGLPIVGGALKALGAGPKLAAGAENYMGRMGMMPQLDVYHGTPHTLPPTPRNPLGEFDASKIGTGEGAQAYGHGIYTAEAKDVATEYARNLANRDVANQGRLNAHANAQRLAAVAGDPAYAADDIKFVLSNEPDHPQKQLLSETLRQLESGDYKKPLANKGNLYKIDLPDEMIAKMLDWDKPLSQQSESVKKALSADKRAKDSLYQNAAEYYRALTSRYAENAPLHYSVEQAENSAQQFASQKLREMGIPGIKYLDATSRDVGKGTRNFVTFPGEEKKMTILERNYQGLTDEEKKRQLAGLLYP